MAGVFILQHIFTIIGELSWYVDFLYLPTRKVLMSVSYFDVYLVNTWS